MATQEISIAEARARAQVEAATPCAGTKPEQCRPSRTCVRCQTVSRQAWPHTLSAPTAEADRSNLVTNFVAQHGSPLPMTSPGNALIHRLPRAVRHRLLDRCELFEWEPPHELGAQGRPLNHAYFPNQGFFSLVMDVDRHPSLEVAMVGPETVLGAELILGVAEPPWRVLVPQPCSSWRVSAKDLREQSAMNPALQRLLQACVLVRLHQQALASACQHYHLIAPRLARWLLMSRDRSLSDSFHVTQEFMALMLGVRRVGVTNAASELQGDGLIAYHRGELTILNRRALEARACSCYAANQRIYARIMGLTPGHS